MTPYWILFSVWAAGAIQFARRQAGTSHRFFYVAAAIATALMIGLRFQVGGDWATYLSIYEDLFFQPLGIALRQTDPGYALLNWLSGQGNLGIWVPNLGCATLFMAGLGRLASRQPNPWLAVLVAVPYLIIVVAMGYTRQAAAIGIVCWAIADASPDRLARLVVSVAIAALFHKTAILFLPILLAPVVTRNPLLAVIGTVAFVLLANLFLGSASDRLIANYANSTYDSQGAAIRVAMNVVAAGLFFVFRERLGFDAFSKSFWTICAILAIVSVVALRSLAASSGVDRLALFLIPLQVVTFSRLPYALSERGRPLPSVLLAVLGYSLAVQFVWLNYAANAMYWVPYRTTLLAAEQ